MGAGAGRGSRVADRLRELGRRIGVRPGWLALLVAAHLAFGLVRFASGSVAKRLDAVAEMRELGVAGWQFRHADDETRRIVDWLVATVPPDQVVLFDGSPQGQLQLLAPLLFPRLLVDASAVRPGGRDVAGRRVFDGRPPSAPADAQGVPVVVGGRWELRLDYR